MILVTLFYFTTVASSTLLGDFSVSLLNVCKNYGHYFGLLISDSSDSKVGDKLGAFFLWQVEIKKSDIFNKAYLQAGSV
jgi:hypothetical protein